MREIPEKFEVSGLYKDESKHAEILEYLGDRDQLFWDTINLVYLTSCIKSPNISTELELANTDLTERFLNSSVGCYKMICLGLEYEFLVLFRHNTELSSLLKFFVDEPNKISAWLKGESPGRIKPKERRIAVDGNTTSQAMYSKLSNYAHTNKAATNFIGGIFVPQEVDQFFLMLLNSMRQMIEFIYEANGDFITEYKKGQLDEEKHSEAVKLLDISLEKYKQLTVEYVILSYLRSPEIVLSSLEQNGDYEMIDYLQNLK
ncbi:hypothetical protein [Paenibacillus durus]|uniref:Uncharacterized protein n=1 Tax=Paenibacillus durus TaxID=44251 RepID=A0A089HHI9_PAEDU|nr:hypothetical protein [Paenibacillus durus]AIQ11381.1 hypothetical protein PDUR_04810 [Paenibacillus durus]